VTQKGRIHRSPCLQGAHGALEINRIPKRHCGHDKVQAACSVALILERAIAYFAEPIEENGASKRISGLPLVESGVDASAKTRVGEILF
jgi:hypothetical protein